MLTSFQILTAALWLGASAALWLALVPETISAGPFWWINAFIAQVLTVIMLSAPNARPTRTVAHVLHDAECQGRRP